MLEKSMAAGARGRWIGFLHQFLANLHALRIGGEDECECDACVFYIFSVIGVFS
jgi:hypothetical protein